MKSASAVPGSLLTRIAPAAGFAVSLAYLVTYAAGYAMERNSPAGPYRPPARGFLAGFAAGLALVGAVISAFAPTSDDNQ